MAHDLLQYYTGNTTGGSTGLFSAPYYWWEYITGVSIGVFLTLTHNRSGAAWGALIEYWHYTNDTTYNELVMQALLSQTSPTQDFMPAEQMYDEVSYHRFT